MSVKENLKRKNHELNNPEEYPESDSKRVKLLHGNWSSLPSQIWNIAHSAKIKLCEFWNYAFKNTTLRSSSYNHTGKMLVEPIENGFSQMANGKEEQMEESSIFEDLLAKNPASKTIRAYQKLKQYRQAQAKQPRKPSSYSAFLGLNSEFQSVLDEMQEQETNEQREASTNGEWGSGSEAEPAEIGAKKPKTERKKKKYSVFERLGRTKGPDWKLSTIGRLSGQQERDCYQTLLQRMIRLKSKEPERKLRPITSITVVDLTKEDDTEKDHLTLSLYNNKTATKMGNCMDEFYLKFNNPMYGLEPYRQPSDNMIDKPQRTWQKKSLPNTRSTGWNKKAKDVVDYETRQWKEAFAIQKRFMDEIRGQEKRYDALPRHLRDGVAEKIERIARSKNFPVLTPQMNAEVDMIFTRNNGELTVSAQTLKECEYLSIKDLRTLLGSSWLNDAVINSYLGLIASRSNKQKNIYPSVYAFSTFAHSKITSRDNKLHRWFKNVNLFDYDLLLVPINPGAAHWALCFVDNRERSINSMDSLGMPSYERETSGLQHFLQEHYKLKHNGREIPKYKIRCLDKHPQQRNGFDCGMFCIKFSDYVARDCPIDFTQEHIEYFRRLAIWELYYGVLKDF